MPYPPPPPAPGVGEFQAIGLLPAPELPDVTGHNGEFLGTDGIIPEWEPVTGVLPDQAGHAGEFLTTNGSVASWSAATATFPDQTGHAGEVLSTDGSNVSWQPSGTPNVVYDVRTYGAVANDPTNDLAPAFYAAVRAATQTQNNAHLTDEAPVFGRIYIPTGQWFTSVPLCPPGGMEVCGDNPMLTMLYTGTGGPNVSPSNVHAFSGPIVYGAVPYTPTSIIGSQNAPVFTTSLATGPGFSLPLVHAPAPGTGVGQFWLHDSYPWSVWLGNAVGTTQFGLQFFLKITEAAPGSGTDIRGIISSRGPTIYARGGDTVGTNADNCFGVYAVASGGNWHLRCFLTTNPAWTNLFNQTPYGVQQEISTSNLTVGTTYYVELAYNGSFFDVYLAGVNQGHVGCTGPVHRTPWEGVAIGAAGPEALDYGGVSSVNGLIDSIRLSSVPNHTGTSSYTPPTTKHTFDSNTMALYNWDQGYKEVTPSTGGTPIVIPAIVGQVRTSTQAFPTTTPSLDGPLPHYIRIPGGDGTSGDCWYHDFGINGMSSCSGLVIANAMRNRMWNIWTTSTSMFGIHVFTAVSFFFQGKDFYIGSSWNQGINYFGTVDGLTTAECAIGAWNTGGGALENVNHQGTWNAFVQTFLGPGSGSPLGKIVVNNVLNDSEVWSYVRQVAPLAVAGQGVNTITFSGNAWDAGGSSKPCAIYYSQPNGHASHRDDTFLPNIDGRPGIPEPTSDKSPCYISFPNGTPADRLEVELCTFEHPDQNIPISDKEGWVARFDVDGLTNFSGINISDSVPTQFSGEFTIQDAYTAGGPVFPVVMPDGNYNVTITPKRHLGSAPAAGSNRITGYTTEQNTFAASIETAPGAGSTMVYGYAVEGIYPPPALFIFAPTTPTTAVNPYAGQGSTFPFAVGLTLRPAANEVLTYNGSDDQPQALMSMGTVPGTPPYFDYYFDEFNLGIAFKVGAGFGALGQATVVNGKLLALYSSGAHNLVFDYPGDGSINLYVDGTLAIRSVAGTVGTHTSTLFLGQRWDGSQELAAGTLHNVKVDQNVARVFSNDNDIGPGTMDQAVFIGDELSIGQASTSASGGWASQIAAADYGTIFWHMAALWHGTLFHGNDGITSLLQNVWVPWGGASTAPALTKAVVMTGLVDIAGVQDGGVGHSATDVWAKMLLLLEGSAASVIFNPPTSTTTPTDQRAQAIVTGSRSAGVSHYTINGTAINSTFNTTSHQTAVDFKTAIDGTPALSSVFATTVLDSFDGSSVRLSVKVAGSSGNGLVMSCDGAAGSFCFGDVGGFPSVGLTVATYNGKDTTIVINGTVFPVNFDTDANTTVNNAITLINADAPTAAIVTPTNVGGTLVITANAVGFAGNAITVSSSGYNIPTTAFTPSNVVHLVGGADGVIQVATDVVLCTVPPFGQDGFWTSGKETQRVALNVLISAYSQPNVTIYNLAASSGSGGVAKPTDATLVDPTMVFGSTYLWNDAGHTQVFTAISALL